MGGLAHIGTDLKPKPTSMKESSVFWKMTQTESEDGFQSSHFPSDI